MRNRESIIGRKFARLTVVSTAPDRCTPGQIRKQFLCRCECGKEIITQRYYLTSGQTKSCGCLALQTRTKHGHCLSNTYSTWQCMKQRCLNPHSESFSNYGSRGITICKQWVNSFEIFLDDMGEAPEGMSIERINNNGNYEPGNCKWATDATQMRNTRRNVFLTVNGVTACLTDLCVHFNLPLSTIKTRLKRGWPIEKAFNRPIGKYARSVRFYEGR